MGAHEAREPLGQDKAALVHVQLQPAGLQKLLCRHPVHIQVAHLAAVDPAQGRWAGFTRLAKCMRGKGFGRFVHWSGQNAPGALRLLQEGKRRAATVVVKTGDIVGKVGQD